MTEPNATPAPLTPERCSKRIPMPGVWSRDMQCSRKSVGVFDGRALCKRHSPEGVKAREKKSESAFLARMDRDLAPARALASERLAHDATRAKLAEAEAKLSIAEGTVAAFLDSADSAESRVAALTLTLAKCKGALDEVGILSVTEAQRIVYATIEAALSPSQDAKEARDA